MRLNKVCVHISHSGVASVSLPSFPPPPTRPLFMSIASVQLPPSSAEELSRHGCKTSFGSFCPRQTDDFRVAPSPGCMPEHMLAFSEAVDP